MCRMDGLLAGSFILGLWASASTFLWTVPSPWGGRGGQWQCCPDGLLVSTSNRFAQGCSTSRRLPHSFPGLAAPQPPEHVMLLDAPKPRTRKGPPLKELQLVRSGC